MDFKNNRRSCKERKGPVFKNCTRGDCCIQDTYCASQIIEASRDEKRKKLTLLKDSSLYIMDWNTVEKEVSKIWNSLVA